MCASDQPTHTHVSLAKALGVTVTTVKSYRRKFPEFWRVASLGKPIRFPAEALELGRRIKHHFRQGLSVEETRARLAKEFEAAPAVLELPSSPPGEMSLPGAAPAPEPLARIESLMEGLFTLQNRTHSLLAELVSKLDTLADHFCAPSGEVHRDETAHPSGHEAAGQRPPQALLALPVVVRSPEGDFLGVTSRSGKPFTLAQFETFLAGRGLGGGQYQPSWLNQGQEWILRLTRQGQGPDQGQTHDHHFLQALTPKGNAVARFASLSVGGKPASEAALQAFLRQVKDTLDQ